MARTNSQLLAQEYAAKQTLSRIHESHGRIRVKYARFATLIAEVANHYYRLCKLRAHDALMDVKVWSNGGDSGMTDCNLGAWVPNNSLTADPATVVKADGLFDGQNLSGAATGAPFLGAGANGVVEADMGKPLWEALGVSAEPAVGTEYEIVLQVVGASNPVGGGSYCIGLYYVAGD